MPSVSKFREQVERISDKRDSLLIKTTYLTAGRVSELLTKTSPYDLKHGKSHPYGLELDFRIEDFVIPSTRQAKTEKMLLLKLRIAKRKRKVIFKSIALPTKPEFEPWCLDLMNFITKTGSVTFPIVRNTAWRIVKKRLDIHPHLLRHYRLTHLVDTYGFDQWDLIIYAGWTLGGAMGVPVPLDSYIHLDWRRYVPKLLRKISRS